MSRNSPPKSPLDVVAAALVRALLAAATDASVAPVSPPVARRPRARHRGPAAPAAPAPLHSPVPELDPSIPAPPVTQAEVDAMERTLAGASPNGYYRPGEGVAPWMESS
jgi:hypothetical protein